MAYKITCVICALCFVIFSACSGSNNTAEVGWLHGTWQVSHNPENDDEDDMVFMADGKVLIKSKQGDLKGYYAVEGRLLRMLITVNGKPVPTEFRVSQNNAKLIFKNGAEYSRKVP